MPYPSNVMISAAGDLYTTEQLLDGHFKGVFASLVALETAYPTAEDGDFSDVDSGIGSDVQRYIWDASDSSWVVGSGGAVGPAGPSGLDGDSAYAVAVANGFVGDEAAWLASLVGATGATGPAGPSGGIDGADGSSAYEVAVANGFVGDEAAWLASLVGATGATGPAGAPGATGATGPAGADGADGADGASAYEVAVANGFVGTEAEWLASLGGAGGPTPGSVTVTEETAGGVSTYEVQSVSVVGVGTYALEGVTLAHDATAETVETALNSVLSPAPAAPTLIGVKRNGTYPAGIVAGDLIIAFISASGSTTTPSGWTFITGGAYAKCYAKTAAGGETGPHPVFTTSDIREIYVFRNACTPYELQPTSTANFFELAGVGFPTISPSSGGTCTLVRHFYSPSSGQIVANQEAWSAIPDAFKTRILEGVPADGTPYSDSMTVRADDFDTGNLYTIAVFGEGSAPAVTVTGGAGEYAVTWNSYGDKPLLGTSSIALSVSCCTDGADGVGIADVEIDLSNHLIVTLTDLTEIDAGALPTGSSPYDGCGCFTPWTIPAGKYFTGPHRATLAYTPFPGNYLFSVPLMVEYEETWTRIGVRCNSGTGSLRLGIFSSTDGLPGDLLVDSGVLAASAGEIEATISQTLAPGLYWLCLTSDTALSLIARDQTYDGAPTPWSPTGLDSNIGYVSSARSFQALPSVCPTATAIANGIGPRLWLRKV